MTPEIFKQLHTAYKKLVFARKHKEWFDKIKKETVGVPFAKSNSSTKFNEKDTDIETIKMPHTEQFMLHATINHDGQDASINFCFSLDIATGSDIYDLYSRKLHDYIVNAENEFALVGITEETFLKALEIANTIYVLSVKLEEKENFDLLHAPSSMNGIDLRSNVKPLNQQFKKLIEEEILKLETELGVI